jgi:hypothetical protein
MRLSKEKIDKIKEAMWQYKDLLGRNPHICVVNSASGLRNNIMLFDINIAVRDDWVKPHYYLRDLFL